MIKGGDNTSIKAAGVPNITGKIGPIDYSGTNNYVDGAFYADGTTTYGATESGGRRFLRIDASRCSKFYRDCDTIQPPAICNIPQVKI